MSIARTYRVTWTIELDADYPRSAANKALEMQRDPTSTATVFTVTDVEDGREWEIDLDE